MRVDQWAPSSWWWPVLVCPAGGCARLQRGIGRGRGLAMKARRINIVFEGHFFDQPSSGSDESGPGKNYWSARLNSRARVTVGSTPRLRMHADRRMAAADRRHTVTTIEIRPAPFRKARASGSMPSRPEARCRPSNPEGTSRVRHRRTLRSPREGSPWRTSL